MIAQASPHISSGTTSGRILDPNLAAPRDFTDHSLLFVTGDEDRHTVHWPQAKAVRSFYAKSNFLGRGRTLKALALGSGLFVELFMHALNHLAELHSAINQNFVAMSSTDLRLFEGGGDPFDQVMRHKARNLSLHLRDRAYSKVVEYSLHLGWDAGAVASMLIMLGTSDELNAQGDLALAKMIPIVEQELKSRLTILRLLAPRYTFGRLAARCQCDWFDIDIQSGLGGGSDGVQLSLPRPTIFPPVISMSKAREDPGPCTGCGASGPSAMIGGKRLCHPCTLKSGTI